MAEGTLGYSSDRRRFFAKYEHDASKIRPRFPYSDKQWKMTGWTGHNMQEAEVFGNTAIKQQKNTAAPLDTSVLRAARVDPVIDNHTLFKDPCQDSRNWLKPQPDNLFPDEVQSAAQKGTPPFKSTIVFGDHRYHKAVKGKTGYTTMYREFCDSLKSDVGRGSFLFDETDLVLNLGELSPEQVKKVYEDNFKKVMPEMIMSLRNTLMLRIQGKMKTIHNSQTFMLRKLFDTVDSNADGKIQIDEFAAMLQLFGMQMSKKYIVALYSYYDKDFSGSLSLDEFMGDVLEADYYALFSASRESEKEYHERMTEFEEQMIHQLKYKWATDKRQLRQIFRQVDTSKNGSLSRDELIFALKKLAITVEPHEAEWLMAHMDTSGDGQVDYNEFISKFGIKNEESAIGSTPFTNARTGPFAGSEHIKGVLPAGGMKRAGLDAQDYLDSMTDKEAEEARKRAQEAGSKDAFYAAK